MQNLLVISNSASNCYFIEKLTAVASISWWFHIKVNRKLNWFASFRFLQRKCYQSLMFKNEALLGKRNKLSPVHHALSSHDWIKRTLLNYSWKIINQREINSSAQYNAFERENWCTSLWVFVAIHSNKMVSKLTHFRKIRTFFGAKRHNKQINSKIAIPCCFVTSAMCVCVCGECVYFAALCLQGDCWWVGWFHICIYISKLSFMMWNKWPQNSVQLKKLF